MKVFLTVAAAGFVMLQLVLILAIMAAAARPVPQFEPDSIQRKMPDLRKRKRKEELELVA